MGGPEPVKKLNKRSKALLGVVAILVIGFVVWRFPREESTPARANRVIDCVLSANAKCVYEATDERDRAAYNLTVEKVDGLLKEYVKPALGEEYRITPVETSEMIRNQDWVAMRSVTLESGRTVVVGTHATRTGHDSIVPKLIFQILMMTATAKYGNPQLGNAYEFHAMRESAIKDRELLVRLGFNGVFRNDDDGLVSWDDWTKYCDMVIEKVRNAPPPDPRNQMPPPTQP